MSPEAAHRALVTLRDAHVAMRGRVECASVTVTDADAMARAHRFVRDEDEDEDARGGGVERHGVKLAKRYYAKLFKTYAICDLSRARVGERTPTIGMRWRTEKEVRCGKGQFVCGERACDGVEDLESFECHFAYVEAGEKKSALVKVRVCAACALKLGSSDGHTRVSKDERRRRRTNKKSRKRKRGDDDDDDDDERRLLKTLLA